MVSLVPLVFLSLLSLAAGGKVHLHLSLPDPEDPPPGEDYDDDNPPSTCKTDWDCPPGTECKPYLQNPDAMYCYNIMGWKPTPGTVIES